MIWISKTSVFLHSITHCIPTALRRDPEVGAEIQGGGRSAFLPSRTQRRRVPPPVKSATDLRSASKGTAPVLTLALTKVAIQLPILMAEIFI